MPSDFFRKPDVEIQPGDIYSNVPFLFPLPEPSVVREVADGHYERRLERDVELAERELALCERRVVIAMLHPESVACEIDKMIPPDGRPPKPAEDNVLAFFECPRAEQLGSVWREKLKHPERHKRLMPLPEKLKVPQGQPTHYAVQFRRLQQFTNIEAAGFTRVASLTEPGLEAVRVAYEIFLNREKPATGFAAKVGAAWAFVKERLSRK